MPIVALLLLSFVASLAKAQPPEQCTPCADNRSMRNLESPCPELPARTNGLYQTDSDCKDLQLEGYQLGCCPVPPIQYCEFCADGSPPDLDGTVWTGQYKDGTTCFDYSYQSEAMIGIFRDGDCSDTFLQRAGHYCGCPNQKQECWLCPDKQPPGRPAKGDAWVTGSDCRGIEYLYSLLKEDECSTFASEAGADLAIYCMCGGLNQTAINDQAELFTCNLCENGGKVTNPNFVYTTDGAFAKTCGQAEKFAKNVIKTPAACNSARYFGEAREKCACPERDPPPSGARRPSVSSLWSVLAGATVAAAAAVLLA